MSDELRGSAPSYEPSEEEIRQACAEIQETWGAVERQRRLVGESNEPPRVETMVVSASEVDHLLSPTRDFSWSQW